MPGNSPRFAPVPRTINEPPGLIPGASHPRSAAKLHGVGCAGRLKAGVDKLAKLCQIWHTISNGERPKPLFWVGSSKKDLKSFPLEVRRTMGFALFQAQTGGKDGGAQPPQ